jgi:HAD superfamily hydrolase (TIGR01459 family)
MKQIGSLSEIINCYDAVLCDAWGVIHNGEVAHKAALQALEHCKSLNKPVVIITNAPRREIDLENAFKLMGITHQHYDRIVSSGELGREIALSKHVKNVFFLGPEIDLAILSGTSLINTNCVNSCELIINAGLKDNKTELPEEYNDLLHELASHKLEMICLNPDRMVHIGSDIRYCAGELATYYEDIGGNVNWVGKPQPLIYEKSMQIISGLAQKDISPNKVLAIGDAMYTDILGAHNFGISTLFVMSGVHRDHFRDEVNINTAINKLLGKSAVLPDFYIRDLKS